MTEMILFAPTNLRRLGWFLAIQIQVYSRSHSLYMMCIYCDPCNPEKFVLLKTKIPDFNPFIAQLDAKTTIRSVNVLVRMYLFAYQDLLKKGEGLNELFSSTSDTCIKKNST